MIKSVHRPRYEASHVPYLRDVFNQRFITPEEEKELLARWVSHKDPQARKRLIAGNMKRVARIALKLRSYGAPVEDMLSEGGLGMLEALDRWDPTQDVRFFTYAVFWVRARIYRLIIMTYLKGVNRGPIRKHFFVFARHANRWFAENAHHIKALCQETGMEEGEASMALNSFKGDVPSSWVPDPAEEIDHAIEIREEIGEVLKSMDAVLKPVEKNTLTNLFLGRRHCTLQQLGDVTGVSRERVRQRRERALEKVRDHLSERKCA